MQVGCIVAFCVEVCDRFGCLIVSFFLELFWVFFPLVFGILGGRVLVCEGARVAWGWRLAYGVRECCEVVELVVGVIVRRSLGFLARNMSLTAAPRSLYMHNSAIESGMAMERQAPAAVQHYFSPFFLGSFPLRALRRLAMAFNSLSAMAPASFRFNASRMGKHKRNEADVSRSAVGETSASQPRLPLLWFPRFGRSVKEINEVQKRRKLATERFTDDEETGRKIVSFVNSRGQMLFSQSWTRVNSDVELKYALSPLRRFPLLSLSLYN